MSDKKKPLASISTQTIDAKQGKLGVITLDSPKTLNSLTLDMVREIRSKLETWCSDDDIAVVVIRGSGEKAFCAGGDVQKLYQSAIDQPGGPCEYAETFFFEEYQLNYLIHRYRKPILCLARGITMGGGLGLMAGASHRVVTESTRIAMPEITIGLFPDVGGTWFLNRMPNGLGNFFALTGATINALDALSLDLADHALPNAHLEKIERTLASEVWSKNHEENHSICDRVLNELACERSFLEQSSPSELQAIVDSLTRVSQQNCLGEFIASLQEIDYDSKWFHKALASLKNGSPLSSLLIFEQLKRFRFADLKSVFESELVLATNIVRYPEFSEGVRALLIDKDNDPHWQHAHFSAVSSGLLESFFTAPWKDNPLHDALRDIDNKLQ